MFHTINFQPRLQQQVNLVTFTIFLLRSIKNTFRLFEIRFSNAFAILIATAGVMACKHRFACSKIAIITYRKLNHVRKSAQLRL